MPPAQRQDQRSPAAASRSGWARRVTVVTPDSRADVALPLQSTFAEVVPQLLRMSDARLPQGSQNGGWMLTKSGGAALTPNQTVSAAGLRDGDLIYLSPRDGQTPPMLFDDVVDAIASATQTAAGAWQPRVARLVSIAAGGAALLGATLLLFAYLSGQATAPVLGFAAALLLLLVGTALSRGYRDGDAGAACATVGAAAAGLAGMSVLAPHHASAVGARPLSLGLAALAGFSVLALILVRHWSPWFGSLALSAGLGTVAAAVVSLTGVSPAGAVAVLAVLVTAFSPAAPMLALRLARLPMPEAPSDTESFRETETPTLGPDVLRQTGAAQRILAGLLAALGFVVVGTVAVLLRGDHPDQALLAGLLGLVCLLRSRSYASTAQRVVLLSAGLLSLGLLGGWLSAGHHRDMLGGAAVALAVGGLAGLTYARRAAKGRRSPYWSRLMDAAEFLGILALLPAAGLVLNIFQHLRHAVH